MLGKVATVRSLDAARARATSVSSNMNYIQEWVEFMELHVESGDPFMGIFKKYDFWSETRKIKLGLKIAVGISPFLIR